MLRSSRKSLFFPIALFSGLILSRPAFAGCDKHQKDCLKGTPEIFLFVNNSLDRKSQGGYVPDKLMDLSISSLDAVYKRSLAQTIPTDHIHVIKASDLVNGKFTAELQKVAEKSKDSPIDLINLTHGDQGGWVDAPQIGSGDDAFWNETIDDRIFAKIPEAARRHLRLFFNAACFGESAKDWALKRGFVAMVGAPGVSLGPLVVEEFTKQYAAGRSLKEIAQNIYTKCLKDRSWTLPTMAGAFESEFGDTREAYCTKDAALTIVGAQGDVSGFTIDTQVAAHEAVQPDVVQEFHWEPMSAKALKTLAPASQPKEQCLVSQKGVFDEHTLLLKQTAHIVNALEFTEPSLNSPNLTVEFNPDHFYLPNKLTVTPKTITQLDWTGVRLMGVSVAYFRRDTRLNTKWEAGLVRLSIPVLTRSFGGKTLHATIEVSGLGDIGYKSTSFQDKNGRNLKGMSFSIAPELRARIDLLRRAYVESSNAVDFSSLTGRKTLNTYEAGLKITRNLNLLSRYNSGSGFDQKRLDLGFSIRR